MSPRCAMRPFYCLTAFFVVAVACNQTTVETPVRSFDRPSDAALTCVIFNPMNSAGVDVNGNKVGLYENRPLASCAPQPSATVESIADPSTGVSYTPELRVLVANSARGEVALVNVPQEVLIDLDRANPGFNFIPVGRLPEAIRASKDGCLAVTANVDSCDLAVLNLPIMYNMPFVPNLVGQSRAYSKDVVHRIQLTAGGRPIEARPTAIELVPLDTPPEQITCSDRRYRAWVALPGCEAVVETELSLGIGADPIQAEITRAIKLSRGGVSLLADPTQLSCPAECSGGEAPGDAGAPGVPDGGTRLPENQSAPGTLALDLEDQTLRLVIGDLYGERVSIVPLDSTTGEPQAARNVQLEAGALGVARVRISPRSPAGKFVYAVARDNSVHVVDLDLERECETNPDPVELGAVPPEDPLPDARRLGCLPLGDPATPRRSPNAIGPGITLPNGAIPRDVGFVHLDTPIPPDTGAPFSAQPQLLVGDFAWIVGSDGRATVLNVFDACPQPNDPQPPDGPSYTPACALENVAQSRKVDIANNYGNPYPYELERLSHHLRSGLRRFLQPNTQQDTAGTPRIQDPANPVTVTVAGSPANAQAGFRLPSLQSVTRTIEHLTDQGESGTALITLDVPEPMRAKDETWSLAWEGVLPATLRSFGKVCGLGDASCPRGTLVDAGATFCARDVRIGDKLELVGCATDADCLYTQLCVRDPAAPIGVLNGLCLDRDDAGDNPVDGQTLRCSPLLRAQRRYRITAPRQGVTLPNGDVTDQLDLSEIYEPEFASQTHSCVQDTDCADVLIPAPDLVAVQRPPLPTACLLDTDGQKRCLRKCDPASQGTEGLCGDGYLCAGTNTSTADAPDFRCMRSPLDIGLFTDCLKQAQRYQIRTGESFQVVGTVSGLLSELEPNPVTRICETPPISLERVRRRSPRIPLEAPACPQQIDASLGIDALSWVGPAGPNACQLKTGSDDRLYHFENPIFSLALSIPKNPIGYVPADDTIVSFVVVGGGFALGLVLGIPSDPAAQSPKSVVVGPDQQTVYVVDEGKGTTSVSLRGQLLRLISSVQVCDQTFRVR